VIDFTVKDAFWSKNVLSAKTLRDKFDKLEIQAKVKKPAVACPAGMYINEHGQPDYK